MFIVILVIFAAASVQSSLHSHGRLLKDALSSRFLASSRKLLGCLGGCRFCCLLHSLCLSSMKGVGTDG